MKREDRATISVSKKTHADFEEYRAKLSAKRGKVQTQDEVVRALLEMVQEEQPYSLRRWHSDGAQLTISLISRP
jgi:hypothetical protein